MPSFDCFVSLRSTADIIPRRKSANWELPEELVAVNALAREQDQYDRGLRERKHNLGTGGSKTEVEDAGTGADPSFARA